MALLNRSTRGVRLTEAGEALRRHAEAILAERTLAERELEAIAGPRKRSRRSHRAAAVAGISRM